MAKLNKEELLDKLVENEFISAEQRKGFDKLSQEDLLHLVKSSEVVLFLDKGKTDAEATIEELEKKVSDLEKKLEVFDIEVDAKPVKLTPGLKFNFRGVDYKFKDDAPKSIKFGGVALSQKDLAKDEDALLHLVTSGSLIEKI